MEWKDINDNPVKLGDVVQFVQCPSPELVGALGIVYASIPLPPDVPCMTCIVRMYFPNPRATAEVVAMPREELQYVGRMAVAFPEDIFAPRQC